jgi:hypothetical protein
LLIACGQTGVDVISERKAVAERFLRGVYGGDPSVVDELAAEEIVVTYPIFAKLFDTPAIRGRAAVKKFATGFSSRWVDAQITIHESVAENDRVILIWDFRARNVGSAPEGTRPAGKEQSWGGITFYRFNEAGQIAEEIGEESEPGPFGRLAADGDED